MLGLPVNDNMLCRLLLGLAVTAVSCSKPIVALIRFDSATASPGAPGCLKIEKALRTQDHTEDELDHLFATPQGVVVSRQGLTS